MRPEPPSAPLPRGHGFLGLIIKENRSFRIPDIAVDPRRYGFPPNHPPMHSFLGVPITVKGRSVGNLYLTDKSGAAEFSAADERLVETFAVHAGIAIENARLHEQVQRLAIVDERERISQDLHDGIIQNIYAVGLSLEDIPEFVRDDPDEVERRVERAIDSLHLTIRDIRNFIFGLRPELLSGATLMIGLAAIVEEFRHNSMIDVELHAGTMDLEPDPTATAHLLGVVERGPVQHRAALGGIARDGLDQRRTRRRPAASDRGQRARVRSDRRSEAWATRGWPTCTPAWPRLVRPWTSRAMRPARGSRSTDRPTEPTPTRRSPRHDRWPKPTADAPGGRRPRGRSPGPRRRCSTAARSSRSLPKPARWPSRSTMAQRFQPDLVVMDVRLPDGSGIEACREIRAEFPATRVVMLTSYPDEEAVIAAIVAGASGYLLKQVRARDLVAALEAVGRGESLLDPAVTGKVLERMRRIATSDEPDELGALTQQERKILALVAEGKTNKEIAAEVFLSDKTVKNYVSSILAKLNLERRAQAAAYVARIKHPTDD